MRGVSKTHRYNCFELHTLFFHEVRYAHVNDFRELYISKFGTSSGFLYFVFVFVGNFPMLPLSPLYNVEQENDLCKMNWK
jgi:hypothetical protein